MKRYKRNIPSRGGLRINEAVEGYTIEEKVERMLSNKEPIKGEAPLIYTERKDGVVPAYNIRTDKWAVAQAAMDVVEKTMAAKREARAARMEVVTDKKEDGITESTQGKTDQK